MYSTIILLVIFIVNSLLVVGIYRRNNIMIANWLFFTLIGIVFYAFVSFDTILTVNDRFRSENLITAAVINVTFLIVYIYWWFSVFSLNFVIKKGRPTQLDWKKLIHDKEMDLLNERYFLNNI